MLLFITLSVTAISAQNSFEKKDAIAIIDVFVEGFHKGDTLIMNSVLSKIVTLQSVSKNRDGVDVLEETYFSFTKPSTISEFTNTLVHVDYYFLKVLKFSISIFIKLLKFI